MILKREEVLRGGCAVHIRHATYGGSREVHCHRDTIFFGHVADFVGLENPARSCEIGLDLAHRMFLAQYLEWLFEINIFASENGCRA